MDVSVLSVYLLADPHSLHSHVSRMFILLYQMKNVMLFCTCTPLRTWKHNPLFCQSCWSQSLYSLLIFNYGIAFHFAMFAIRTDVDQIIQYLHSIHWTENLLLRGISWLCILRFFDHQQNQPYCWQWYFCWHNVKAICTYTDLPLIWYIWWMIAVVLPHECKLWEINVLKNWSINFLCQKICWH